MKVGNKIKKYYSTQSQFSDPGKFDHLFKDLPASIEELAAIIRGIIIHQHDTKKIYNFDIPKERELEPNIRFVSKILEKIIKLQNDKLPIGRKPEKRFIGLCRDFAIVLCSILRYKGIPARIRCGFTNYYEPGWYVDHWLCEYWQEKEKKWVLVDTEVNDEVRKEYNLKPSFNPLDVRHDQLISAGRAWQMCREGGVDPGKFGVPSIKVLGLWFVMGSLLRDLAALNKIELLPWDYTKYIDRQFNDVSELTEKEIKSADKVAQVIEGVYENWEEAVKTYKEIPAFQVTKEITSYTNRGPRKAELSI